MPSSAPGRPALPGLVAGALADAAGVTGLAWLATSRLDVSREYTASALGIFVLAVGAAGVALLRHHAHDRFGAANQVTLLRAALVSLLAALVPQVPSAPAAWAVVVTAVLLAMLDGLDGWLARRSRLSSPFGAAFDMETDAALVLVLSLLVWTHQKAGAWVLACGVMRYGFGAARWLLPWMRGRLTPTRRGRAVAVLQYFGLAAAIAPAVPYPASAAVAVVTLAVLAWSFGLDVGRLWRQRAH
ncbi:MAG: CDP-alcohol phosphatidyltransferase family protein [Vicinamibacterales bacterium]